MSAGLRDRSSRHRLVVVGGGPAGMAAALEAARVGLVVTLLDEDRRLGGQYYRGRTGLALSGAPRWFADGARLKVHLETAVVDGAGPTRLSTWNPRDGVRVLGCEATLLASGATDRPVPIPGWTLPGVFTAGGALTLAKVHHVRPGRRVVLSGSGPFLLPAAVALIATRARVTILEATRVRESLAGLSPLLRDRATLLQAAGYLAELARHGSRIHYGAGITEIGGTDRVEWVEVSSLDADWRPIQGSGRRLAADAAALGYGFVPRIDLGAQLGCRLILEAANKTLQVAVDRDGRTTVPGVYAAGEVTGIAGARLAELNGRVAGLTAALDLGVLDRPRYTALVTDIRRRAEAPSRTARWLARAYRPRVGLYERASGDTIVCRCEEVTRSAVDEVVEAATAGSVSPRGIKAATRAGMGLCQGRMCAATLLALASSAARGRELDLAATGPMWTPRLPLRPIPLGAIATWPDGEATQPDGATRLS